VAERPLFRLAAMDNASRPLFAWSLEHLFRLLCAAVAGCNKRYRDNTSVSISASTSVSASASRTDLAAAGTDAGLGSGTGAVAETIAGGGGYGQTAHQFVGLGLPFVRKALEFSPDALSLMISLDRDTQTAPRTLYLPVHRLPSRLDAHLLRKQLLQRVANSRASVNGCARADAFGLNEKANAGRRITKILAKAAESQENQFELLENQEEDLRERAVLRSRYQTMSAAYLKDPHARLDVKKSGIHGWGLFAKMSFERNDMIVEYVGQKIRQVVADRREAQYEEEGVGSCYLFRLDKEDIIDATRRGGMARFINHCCEPNAYARVISAPAAGGEEEDEDEKHIIIFAARDMQEGEEIMYDYKFPIEDSKLSCFCGASTCGGYMN